MDEIHGIVEPKLEKVTVKSGYMGKKCATLAQPLPCKEQKCPLRERSRHKKRVI
jgi:hypothetical protein